MLDARTFLLELEKATLQMRRSYSLRDATTAEALGRATELVDVPTQLVRLFLSEAITPMRIEVREKPDDSLLMVLTRGWSLLRATCEIRDAVGESVGTLRRLAGRAASFAIHDPYDKQFADVRGDFGKHDYSIRTPEQDYTLARVRRAGDNISLDISEDLDGQPPAKMRILGAVLSLTMMIDARTRTQD